MQQSPKMGYDRAITVFSPDGRLFQVEYAREAVKRGTTAMGIKAQDGVVLIVDKRISTDLLEPRSIEKIFSLDDHIGSATSGLVADARVLIDKARVESQVNQMSYNEKIDVDTLTTKVCEHLQQYTQYGGVRPFGTALLIAGVDQDTPKLFETDPSGAMMEYKATSIGENRQEIMKYFEKEYTPDLTIDESISLGLQALKKELDEEPTIDSLEIGIARVETGKFEKLTQEELQEYIDLMEDMEEEEESETEE
ncbi:archaeal proteasome endopeptidase complex subunit alpha [Methanonatronarchaeum sp. AMET6-2]|uniref:archaeal proteasome endopeptidase complex subunit alpha n=1 Tax=Methanonatronarchaeum sp. AMET6-2 TaxID=2933293 RepID=UPI00120EBF84|nr:archaeal proteasome endopeptidase complex subunit alpha [Methanonatronarchaeum sp. AMET6-2]RZN63064.1 MAG: archaeal proteasome endopeptidase complex subunit alpha [Methanonatronarchaeia archaeon]UOY09602.1 archaeal proteasome endopeptidase complex subunit alpha [Methanonatronarchaeum sp. AMET6-2]